MAAPQAQQVDDVARPIPLLRQRLVTPGVQQGQQLSLHCVDATTSNAQAFQQWCGNQPLLAAPHVVPGSGLDERMTVQQPGLPIYKLLADGLHQLIGYVLEDDWLQGEGRPVRTALDQHAAAQRFKRDQHLALRHALTEISQQSADRNKFTLDREPPQNRLLKRRRACKLLLEQLAHTIEERIAGGQKGAHVAAKQLANRLRHKMERQRVTAVEARQRAHIGRRPDNILRLQDDSEGTVVQASQVQRAHRRRAAFQRPQLGGLLAAGQHETALVRTLTQGVQ